MNKQDKKKKRYEQLAYTCLIIFIIAVFLSVLFNIIEQPLLKTIFEYIFWISLMAYFIFSGAYILVNIQGKANKLFSLLSFLPLVGFIIFALLMIFADALYIDKAAVIKILSAGYVRDSLQMSLFTSLTTVAITLLFAIPMGYILSRHKFPGRILADTIVDLPIVFPPLVAGLTLLVFFSQTKFGIFIQEGLNIPFVFTVKGIILCQFVVSASFAIRSIKSAFDDVDRRLENVALTLGCTQFTGFFRITLPMASSGIIAGSILTWARAFGLFGPLMIFVGSFRGRTEVLSTTIFLEQSVGNLEIALAVALLMILIAFISLITIRLVKGKTMVRI